MVHSPGTIRIKPKQNIFMRVCKGVECIGQFLWMQANLAFKNAKSLSVFLCEMMQKGIRREQSGHSIDLDLFRGVYSLAGGSLKRMKLDLPKECAECEGQGGKCLVGLQECGC